MDEEFEITEEEIEERRMRHLRGEEFSGKIAGAGLASFSQVLFDVGFSTAEVIQMVLKKMENERDIEISYIQKEMNENLGGVVKKNESEDGEVCNCDDCKSERGEGSKEPEL